MREKVTVFAVGAAGYSGLEILARGYTHWSMALTGGLCLMALWRIAANLTERPLWVQALLGGACITAAEFAVGLVVNVWLGWQVWDYSKEFGNILGQICPLYTLLWVFLSGAACGVMRVILRRRAVRRTK
ncbi:MAG: hypothetical protein RSD62_05345 [Ruthenibacterium sp.]